MYDVFVIRIIYASINYDTYLQLLKDLCNFNISFLWKFLIILPLKNLLPVEYSSRFVFKNCIAIINNRHPNKYFNNNQQIWRYKWIGYLCVLSSSLHGPNHHLTLIFYFPLKKCLIEFKKQRFNPFLSRINLLPVTYLVTFLQVMIPINCLSKTELCLVALLLNCPTRKLVFCYV